MSRSLHAGPAVPLAAAGAAAVIAQFVAGKATRDALFLANFDVTRLPIMVMGASVVSIALAVLMARLMSRTPPARLLPTAFALSGAFALGEWGLATVSPRLTAVLFYLHMLALGPVLVSGYWSVLSERFDPRTAKRRIGQIAAAATLGGVAGSVVADRVAVWGAVSTMLPVVAAANVLAAFLVHRLAESMPEESTSVEADKIAAVATKPATGLRMLWRVPHLRNLALMVLLTTIGAGLLDYVFKSTAVGTLGRGDALLRFFALYYGATNALTFLMQVSVTRPVLEKAGLSPAAGAPSFAVLAGSVGALVVPGLPAVALARGAEFSSRLSLFRSAYELLYTPVAPRDKRLAKPIIDVGFDRTGDLLGAGATRAVLSAVAPALQRPVVLAVAMVASLLALVVSRRLTRGYVQALERSLLDQAVRLDLAEVNDLTTRTTMVRTLGLLPLESGEFSKQLATERTGPAPQTPAVPSRTDTIVDHIVALRSRDRERILPLLRQDRGLDPLVVAHVIPLLAWDPVAPNAADALRRVAEEHLGQLEDALLNPDEDFAIRRRIARLLSVCVSQRAVDGLLLALDDRFEVRFQCGRSLAAIADRNPRLRVDRERVFDVVVREVSVSRGVWESQRLLDAIDTSEGSLFVDQFIRNRAGQSMAHVFTLLSLVLNRDALQIAYRGLHVDDPVLRGTALEYLESVLPTRVRARLWPFLEDARSSPRPSTRTREEIVADLLRSNESIMINLAELKRRGAESESEEDAPFPVSRPV